jgi:SAM-dependent methyltransferase
MMLQKEWFEAWFDSPYYHILYKHRDDQEAASFIDRISSLLNINFGAKVLDLACGRGRHAIYLSQLGYDVIGLDLSEKSIARANAMSNDKLHFYVHDMRNLFRSNYFDYIFNLFTSFGYFERDNDDLRVLQNVSKSLVKGGVFIFDFLNVGKIQFEGEVVEHKQEDDIQFAITKREQHGRIVKSIEFNHQGMDFHFEERVKLISLATFEQYMKASGLEIMHLFGNYELQDFNEQQSDRLIIIARKP